MWGESVIETGLQRERPKGRGTEAKIRTLGEREAGRYQEEKQEVSKHMTVKA